MLAKRDDFKIDYCIERNKMAQDIKTNYGRS